MELKDYRLRIFLWDQLIRPIKKIANRNIFQSFLIALIIINFISFKSLYIFWISIILVAFISIMDIIKYYKSGEYIKNYRKEKYPEYRKTIKKLKKEKTMVENVGQGEKNKDEEKD